MSPWPPFNLLYLVSANIVKNQVNEIGYTGSKKDVFIRMLFDPQQAVIGTPRPLVLAISTRLGPDLVYSVISY